MNNNFNNEYSNNFTEAPDKSTSAPIEIFGSKNKNFSHRTPKKAKNGNKIIALLVCCCIVFSGAAGFGGMFLAWNFMNNKTVQSQSGTTANAVAAEKNNVIYKSVGIPNTGSLVSDNALVNAISIAKNSVVEITTEIVKTSSYFGQYVTQGAGSGVIISDTGLIITCEHVITGATNITVKLANGKEYTAELIGEDSETDIAVIQIKPDDVNEFTVAGIGSSKDLVLGETAIAIGNPLGELGGSVTNGIISALDREVKIGGQTYTLLQTNAAINPGNSGGGLFDINGKLIGVVNAKSSGSEIEGLGFAIPIDEAINIADQLITNGYISGRARLGVMISEITTSTSSSQIRSSEYAALLNYITDYGVYFLKYIDENTNGDLQFGDRIVAIDGYSVSSKADITSLLREYNVGDEITITVSRLVDPSNARSNQSKMVDCKLTLVEDIPEGK